MKFEEFSSFKQQNFGCFLFNTKLAFRLVNKQLTAIKNGCKHQITSVAK